MDLYMSSACAAYHMDLILNLFYGAKLHLW